MADLQPIQELYDRGLFLEAYRRACELGPPVSWRGAEERVLAGRLAYNLGSQRLGWICHRLALREHPDHAGSVYFGIRALLQTRGPLDAWEFLKHTAMDEDVPRVIRAELASLRACVAALLRDFHNAEEWFAQAQRIAPDNPWIYVDRSGILELEDRYEEALGAARRSLKIHPDYHGGLLSAAHLLQLLGRDEECLELLQGASKRLESGHLVVALVALEEELGLHEEARQDLERLPDLWPMMDEKTRRWLDCRRSDLAYQCGNLPVALEFLQETDQPFHQKVRDRMTKARPEDRRVVLALDFVRQHHMTCAPATLSTISRFWSMAADHLEVAEEICYDGTSWTSERRWAEEAGWIVREFTVAWEIGVVLIDRGVPFTLTTRQPDSSHLQALVGFDEKRGTFLVRDPYERSLVEFLGEELFRYHAAVGPRGMALVPRDRADLLDGLELPDAELYDRYYELERHLLEHRRDEAEKTLARMRDRAPEHRLTAQAALSLASYDADTPGEFTAVEKLSRMYPESTSWMLHKCSLLGRLGRREEQVVILAENASKPGADPVVLRNYAQALRGDATLLPRALRLIRKSIRMQPAAAPGHYILASLLWDARRFDEAREIYRFAACLADKEEQFARAYLTASRHVKRADEALAFLEDRFHRFGHKSSGPIETLFWALTSLDRTTEAFGHLQAALTVRPDDGDLLLFAADAHSRYSRFGPALELLERARGSCRRASWLRTAARIHHYQGELLESLGLWREVLEIEPLAMDAHSEVTLRLGETEGPSAAIAHLERSVRRFPHHLGLQELRIEWLPEESRDTREQAIRDLLSVHPQNAWARREISMLLADQERFDEAFAELDEAERLEPHSPALRNVKGYVLRSANRLGEAREEFRRAIRLSVDEDFAMAQLLSLAETAAQRLEELELIRSELIRQVTFGRGLLAYRDHACNVLDPEDVLSLLRDALAARPDLRQAWSALLRQLTDMQRLDEAMSIADEATKRFPLQAELLVDCAMLYRRRLDRDGELRALEQALMAQPDWSVPARFLAELYEREGNFEASIAVLERAVARDPLDAANHGCLADAQWKSNEREAALESLRRAVRLFPGYDWAWNQLAEWSVEAGRDDLALDLARELTERRSGEPGSWVILARMLGDAHPLAEKLEALDRALQVDPRHEPAHDLRAFLFARAGMYDEAIAACQPQVWGGTPPIRLRARAAWVEAERGQLTAAVSRMRGVLEDDASLYWGWRKLAEWYEKLGNQSEFTAAAEQLVRLCPDDPEALIYFGQARLHAGDREGAKSTFHRLLVLRPDALYTGRQLFEMQLADGEHTKARETLERVRPHLQPHEYSTFETEIACGRRDKADAAESLAALVNDPEADAWCLETALEAMATAGWQNVSMRCLSDATLKEGPNPLLGAMLVEQSGNDAWTVLRRLEARPTLWKAGVERLAQRGLTEDQLRRLIARHRKRLAEDTQLWGLIGYAFSAAQCHRSCLNWLSDWKERDGLESWMLYSLALACHHLGRHEAAAKVHRHALTLTRDGSSDEHELWLALEEVTQGRVTDARLRLERVNRTAFGEYARTLLAMVELAAAAGEKDNHGGSAGRRRQLDRLLKEKPWILGDGALRGAYLRCSGQAGRGGTRRLWILWVRARLKLFSILRFPFRARSSESR